MNDHTHGLVTGLVACSIAWVLTLAVVGCKAEYEKPEKAVAKEGEVLHGGILYRKQIRDGKVFYCSDQVPTTCFAIPGMSP